MVLNKQLDAIRHHLNPVNLFAATCRALDFLRADYRPRDLLPLFKSYETIYRLIF